MQSGSLLFLATILLAYVLNTTVPQPYMDEIFHVHQTKRYLGGDFLYWDAKITTPPTLYLLGSLYGFLPSKWFPVLAVLRSFNVAALFALTVFLLKNFSAQEWAVLCIATFPPLYFFCFLFYTDVLSVALVLSSFVLVCHSVKRRQRQYLSYSAYLALVSVTVRQSNVLWAFFNAAAYILLMLVQDRPAHRSTVSKVVACLRLAVSDCLGYLCIALLFGLFIYWNKGIVLGDKSHHQVSTHWAQLVYFFAFVATFMPAHCITILRSWRRSGYPMVPLLHLILWSLAAAFFISHYRFAHIFVLSDNRHYTFYFYKRILTNSLRYVLLVPVSAIGVAVTHVSLTGFPVLLRAVYLLCVVCTTVTSELIEPRYFLVGFLILYIIPLLRTRPVFSRSSHLFHLMYYVAINALVLFVFLFRPFVAPDGSVGRFMW